MTHGELGLRKARFSQGLFSPSTHLVHIHQLLRKEACLKDTHEDVHAHGEAAKVVMVVEMTVGVERQEQAAKVGRQDKHASAELELNSVIKRIKFLGSTLPGLSMPT